MGTGRPHVEITAVTLAGGEKNQDRYAYGDGWAFVLDGASSFTKTQPDHDGGWYAEHLKQALSAGLEREPIDTTPEIVERAIRTVAELHDGDAANCPTSTIALARWDDKSVEVYLLGDSTVALLSSEGEEVLSDARLENIALPIREEYRSRLRHGHGFDIRHRELLQQLQAEQAAARNRPNGYWIAGAEPEAAHHGLTVARPLVGLEGLVIATDGAAAGDRYGTYVAWRDFARQAPDQSLQRIDEAEAADAKAQKWPRSKLHDDKTALIVELASPPEHS
jgi:hypothetical protein